jgi:hypothetical protein
MRRALLVLAVALGILSLGVVSAAQEEKWARGTISTIGADSITVDVKGQAQVFAVTQDTDVIAPGAGTKTRETKRMTGKAPTLSELFKVGDNVEVSYTESGGKMTAKLIRGGVSAPSMTSADAPRRMEGVVTAVTAASFTVKPASGEAVMFSADDQISITGRGLGTMSREKKAEGGKVVLTDALAVGDTVAVTYKLVGDAKQATSVSVIKKGS